MVKKNVKIKYIILKIFLMCLLFISCIGSTHITRAEDSQIDEQKPARIGEVKIDSYQAVIPAEKYVLRKEPAIDLVEEKQNVLNQAILREGGATLDIMDGDDRIWLQLNVSEEALSSTGALFDIYETAKVYNYNDELQSNFNISGVAKTRDNSLNNVYVKKGNPTNITMLAFTVNEKIDGQRRSSSRCRDF